MKTKRRSPALQLISLVWEHNREATGHSWQRLNSSMHAAVKLAIDAGMRFDDGDFIYIDANFRPGYWLGNDGGCGEWMYAHAVALDNESACVSIDKWKGREAMRLHGRRLCIGAEITNYLNFNSRKVDEIIRPQLPEWCCPRGRITVTSIGADFVGVTQYKRRQEGEYATKVARRWKVTKEQITAVNKLIRDAQKAAKQPETEAA